MTDSAFLSRIKARLQAVEREAQDYDMRAATARAKAATYREILAMAEPQGNGYAPARGEIKPDGTVAKAISILEAEGAPMHLFAIMERAGFTLDTKTKRAVGAQINAYRRKGRFFTIEAPNTFGLISWKNHEHQHGVEHDQESERLAPMNQPAGVEA